MPGTADRVGPSTWFQDEFGFKETPALDAAGHEETKSHFTCAAGVLTCKATGKMFQVGPWSTPTLEKCQERLDAKLAEGPAEGYSDAGGLTFENIVGDTMDLHRDPENAGAVFQVSTLFNCLETTEGKTPIDPLTRYAEHQLQGSACAVACPAATVFRNFFVNGGQGQAQDQVDCLSAVALHAVKDASSYWTMQNGFCMPRVPGSVAKVSNLIAKDPVLGNSVRQNVQVGVHWDTEVAGGSHSVCQVFCSSLPVGMMKAVRSCDWEAFATVILEAVYEATLAVAALFAARRGTRVKVYLTAVGGGMLGNRTAWISEAIDRALSLHKKQPLDVMLVHYATLPRENGFARLEVGRRDPTVMPAGAGRLDRSVSQHLIGLGLEKPAPALEAQIMAAFASYDVNGDGVIDYAEFYRMLSTVDPNFFTAKVVKTLLTEADADGDGEVHYAEFVAWVCQEDEDIIGRLIPQ
mmetsp:Transcript_63209/g.135770  ORF Transcript_63209/g.135770 Transcript_63209/m.135770 type:complete len:465 (-) Transcript_63209:70-1464(-)